MNQELNSGFIVQSCHWNAWKQWDTTGRYSQHRTFIYQTAKSQASVSSFKIETVEFCLLYNFLVSNLFLCYGNISLSYINNHENGELQVAPNKGEYATLNTVNNHYQSGGS